MSAQETAEAILMVIKKLAKWIAIGIIVIALLGGAIYSVLYIQGWYQFGRHASKVVVIAKFDKAACADKKYPLELDIVNNSTRTINNTRYRVQVTEIGHSSTLNDGSDYHNDAIIKPNEAWKGCHQVFSEFKENLDGENKTVVVTYSSVRFFDE